ncbi:MAG TPA: RHS repeat-associated core domain-containing protein, partial [Clostridia bacterium]|nr:RHS repeat-associated core domain-containing protein [Clostridia bacterium]
SQVTQVGSGVTNHFVYNDSGIRVRSWSSAGGSPTLFLVDANNHTGYAQVLEELTALGGTPTRSYVIGDDVMAQGSSVASYLLYDGHGSTRQLADAAGAVTSRYNYDAYGQTETATSSAQAETSLLYCGEQYDSSLEMYNLRARYYNPANGRFNQRDSFAGNNEDPQSLHKYAYAADNPVNRIDPSGLSDTSAVQQSGTMTIGGYLAWTTYGTLARMGLQVTFNVARVGMMIDKGILYAEFASLAVPVGLQAVDSAFGIAERAAARWENNPIVINEGPGENISYTLRGQLLEGIALHGEAGYKGGTLEVFDGQSPKGVSFSAGTIGLANGSDLESRVLSAVRAKLAEMDQASGRLLVGTDLNGEQARILPGSTKLQMGILGIPENQAYLLRSTSFRAALMSYRQTYQSWIAVIPIRNWRMLWTKN